MSSMVAPWINSNKRPVHADNSQGDGGISLKCFELLKVLGTGGKYRLYVTSCYSRIG